MNNVNVKHTVGQKASNFAELYEQHLKNINKGLAKRTTNTKDKGTSHHSGLSQMAKKIIIKNLSTYHRNNF